MSPAGSLAAAALLYNINAAHGFSCSPASLRPRITGLAMVATDSPAGPTFKTMLGDLQLASYLEAFEEEGYDDLALLQQMSAGELKEMFVDIGMKKGHALKLQKYLSVPEETGWPVDMKEGLVDEQPAEVEQSVQQPLPAGSVDSAMTTDDSELIAPAAEGALDLPAVKLAASNVVQEQEASQAVQSAQPAAAATKEGNPLPASWAGYVDPQTGKTYYYNQQTGATTWERPSADTDTPSAGSPPASPAASPPTQALAATSPAPAQRKRKNKRSKTSGTGFSEAPAPTPMPASVPSSAGTASDKDWSWTGSAAATAPVRDQLERQSRSASTFKPPRKRELAVPFLSPPAYLDGSLPGDRGFDPLGMSKDPSALMWMREAEIKHSRLAMLAAVGWPVSELLHPAFAKTFGATSLVDLTDGRAPAVLNGGLGQVSVVYWLGVFAVAILAEVFSMATLTQDERAAGELGFDPLNLIAPSFIERDPSWNFDKYQEEKRTSMESELKHGRLAMFAITVYALQEAITGTPVMH